jgi:uncharacterized small protein (TIGR04563 family)
MPKSFKPVGARLHPPGQQHQQSINFDPETRAEIVREAKRLDRSITWLLRRAWQLARAQMQEMPGAPKETDDAQ